MLIKISISRVLSILFLGILMLMSFVPVYAAPSLLAEQVKAANTPSPLQFAPGEKALGVNITNLAASPAGESTTMRDIVLVIDTTSFMAFATSGNPNMSDPGDDPALCNVSHTCQPLEAIKSAAIDFIDLLSFPSDRVGIVTMTSQNPAGSRTPITISSISSNKFDVLYALGHLDVFEPPSCDSLYGVCRDLCTAAEISDANNSGNVSNPCYQQAEGYYVGQSCPVFQSTGDPSSCTSTDVGTSLQLAGSEFSRGEARQNAQQIIVALVSGPANASVDGSDIFSFGFCPLSTWNSPTSPFCRDASSLTRHPITNLNYDADDYARDMADFVTNADTGLGVKVFTIGLGNLIRNTSKGDPDAGEKLLQYISLTAGGSNANHGSYFYAPDTGALPLIFQTIADATITCLSTIVVSNDHDAGVGSLRKAISDICSEGTITFDPSLSGGAIFLASPLLIENDMTINGSSLASHIAINGDTNANGSGDPGDVSIFQISASSTVELNSLNIMDGTASGTTGGGGIANYGTLTVKNSTLSHNSYAGGIGGGGIYNKGELTVIDTVITGNVAEDGGGIFNEYGHTLTITGSTFSNNSAQSANTLRGGGGGIVNIGTLTVEDTDFIGNDAAGGGGAMVNSLGGSVIISSTTFTENTTPKAGGAINNFEGNMSITQSAFSDNVADVGGAIDAGDFQSAASQAISISDTIISNNEAREVGGAINIFSGSAIINNTTISENSGLDVGGIVNVTGGSLTITSSTINNNLSSHTNYPGGILTTGPTIITNSTITNNTTGGIESAGQTTINNSTIAGNGSYGIRHGTNTLNLNNSIISNNLSDCTLVSGGVIGANQNNLIKVNACGIPSLTVDPKLGPLANNGGSTLTMSLLPGSPAIDAGDDAVCASAPVNNTSQNGVTRPVGIHCDIGSFEYVDTIAPTVSTITRVSTNPTAATSVDFTVTFSESVTGVSAADFVLNTSGVAGASLTGVSGSGTTYNVTVNTGSGSGTIRLNVPVGVSVTDLAGNSLANLPFTSGQFYTVNRSVLRAPILRSPRTNTISNNNLPTFWWTNVAGGQTYEIVFAMDSAFVDVVDSEIVVGSPYIGVLPLNDGKYFWRVRAYNGSNQPGAWSSYRTLTIDTTVPPTPVLNSPASNSSTRSIPIFRWQSVDTAVAYQFQFDKDSSFASPNYSVTTRGNFRRPPAMKVGTYFWHVRAKDAAGNWSAWSTPFTINITDP